MTFRGVSSLHQDLMKAIGKLRSLLETIQPLGGGISFQAWTARAINICTATVC